MWVCDSFSWGGGCLIDDHERVKTWYKNPMLSSTRIDLDATLVGLNMKMVEVNVLLGKLATISPKLVDHLKQ